MLRGNTTVASPVATTAINGGAEVLKHTPLYFLYHSMDGNVRIRSCIDLEPKTASRVNY